MAFTYRQLSPVSGVNTTVTRADFVRTALSAGYRKDRCNYHRFLLLLVSITASALCQGRQTEAEDCPSGDDWCIPVAPHSPLTKVGEAGPLAITSINVHVRPIFDESNPTENNALFRLVNRLHIETREGVIKHDLLVRQGDELKEIDLVESERILRTRGYLNQAKVSAAQTGEAQAEVNVDVHQVWTLFPALSFSRGGGNSKHSFGLHDSNFLGYGKTVDILHKSSDSRNGYTFEYRDPNTGWHQTNLALIYENNSDGDRRFFSFNRPYFSLTTPNAGGFTYEQFDQEDTLHNEGDEVDKIGHSANRSEIYFGGKMGLATDKNIHRWNLGYTREEDTFQALPGEPGLYGLPQDRDFATPWMEYQYIRDGFIEARNINQINRIEDINLGTQFRLRLGRSSSSYSDYDNSYQLSGDISKGFAFNPTNMLLTGIDFNGRYKSGQIYDGLVTGHMDYHWDNFERGQFYVLLEASRGLRLFADQPLVLGGDTGLRGYPKDYEMGDKRYLLNVEQRFYGEKEWFSLFHMGYAIFYDQGRSWGDSLVPQTQQGELRDLGIGLRISGTRNGNRKEGGHNILHIDLATPLNGGSDISSLQWLVKVRHSF